ncbi:MAG: hypothetical protein K1X53_05675 [Candidatus Sumerlaeaceae bacterium]|nr:hypothetical protein [Candidatus Sumerlaeaceae bacterium]
MTEILVEPQFQYVLYESSIKSWLPPNDQVKIPDELRRQIAAKIAKFLTEEGHRTIVVPFE